MEDLDDLGFTVAYRIETAPEFPGDGNWPCALFGFDRQGHLAEPFESRWGTPIVVRVEPDGADEWVGTFASGGLGGQRGIYGCPSPKQLCILADGLAYLVDVTQPASGAVIAHDQVHQVIRVPDRDLVLLVRPIDIVAIGVSGIAWQTPRLMLDDLRVVRAGPDTIVCSGDNLGGTPEIELDPKTGRQTAGTGLGLP